MPNFREIAQGLAIGIGISVPLPFYGNVLAITEFPYRNALTFNVLAEFIPTE